MDGHGEQAAEVLELWFVQSRPRQFAKDPVLDALLRERFLDLTRRAIAGELDVWNAESTGGLALSLRAVELGWLEAEPAQARRQFWLMPLMHSEDLTVQVAALPLFERFADPRTAEFARRHRDVIAGFARFPTSMVQPISLQALCALPSGLGRQLPTGSSPCSSYTHHRVQGSPIRLDDCGSESASQLPSAPARWHEPRPRRCAPDEDVGADQRALVEFDVEFHRLVALGQESESEGAP